MKTTITTKDDSIITKVIITCFLTGCMEMYDFTIFGFLTETLKRNYFGFLDSKINSVISYMIVAVGFIFRPFGACIFGYLGDKFGRKKSLVISILVMASTCLCIAVLPTFDSIGIISCYILVLLRILQGISVGGEYTGSVIFAIEHSKKEYKGLVGSIVTSGAMVGILLASLVGFILQIKILPSYSWRFAFVLGFLLSLLGFFVRDQLPETPVFIRSHDVSVAPIGKIAFWCTVQPFLKECLCTIFIVGTSGVNFYFNIFYIPNYLTQVNIEVCELLSSLSVLVMIILVPVSGFLSDRIGRIRLMYIGVVALIFSSFLLNFAIHSVKNNFTIYISVFMHIIANAIFTGPMNTLITEIFPTEVRYRCSAFSFTIGMGVVSGTMPMIDYMLYAYFGNIFCLGVYMSCISILGLYSLRILSNSIANVKISLSI